MKTWQEGAPSPRGVPWGSSPGWGEKRLLRPRQTSPLPLAAPRKGLRAREGAGCSPCPQLTPLETAWQKNCIQSAMSSSLSALSSSEGRSVRITWKEWGRSVVLERRHPPHCSPLGERGEISGTDQPADSLPPPALLLPDAPLPAATAPAGAPGTASEQGVTQRGAWRGYVSPSEAEGWAWHGKPEGHESISSDTHRGQSKPAGSEGGVLQHG